jgi:hypothetical protein
VRCGSWLSTGRARGGRGLAGPFAGTRR